MNAPPLRPNGGSPLFDADGLFHLSAAPQERSVKDHNGLVPNVRVRCRLVVQVTGTHLTRSVRRSDYSELSWFSRSIRVNHSSNRSTLALLTAAVDVAVSCRWRMESSSRSPFSSATPKMVGSRALRAQMVALSSASRGATGRPCWACCGGSAPWLTLLIGTLSNRGSGSIAENSIGATGFEHAPRSPKSNFRVLAPLRSALAPVVRPRCLPELPGHFPQSDARLQQEFLICVRLLVPLWGFMPQISEAVSPWRRSVDSPVTGGLLGCRIWSERWFERPGHAA